MSECLHDRTGHRARSRQCTRSRVAEPYLSIADTHRSGRTIREVDELGGNLGGETQRVSCLCSRDLETRSGSAGDRLRDPIQGRRE